MQWAKPRSIDDRASTTASRKIDIKVDLTGELDEDSAATRSTAATRQRNDTPSPSKVARTERGSTAGQVSQTPGFEGTSDPARQWLPGTHSEERSAWDYYSRSAAQDNGAYPQDSSTRATYDHRDHDSEEYEDDPYFGDMTPYPAPQHNRSSWDAAPTRDDQPDQSNWSQYIWPFMVVAFIVFLAFLTLIT